MSWQLDVPVKVGLKTYPIQFSAGLWSVSPVLQVNLSWHFQLLLSIQGVTTRWLSSSPTWCLFRIVKVLPLHLLVFGSWSERNTEPTHSLVFLVVAHPLCPNTSLVLLVTYSDRYTFWRQLSGLMGVITSIHNNKNDSSSNNNEEDEDL